MADYLLEIGLEEVPAGTISGVIEQLRYNISEGLKKNSIHFETIKTYGTPRRIAVLIKGLGDQGDAVLIENRGPSLKAALIDGKPSRALEGFCKGQGISIDEIVIKSAGKDDYVFCIKNIEGVNVKENIGAILKEAIDSLYFNKPMFWGENNIQFIRPIRFLVSLWDDEVLPFAYAGIEAGRYSRGHRFLSNFPVEIMSALSYEENIENSYVIPDIDKRKKIILEGLQKKEDELQNKIVIKEDLLNEVLFLVEYPTIFVGGYSKDYLKLPKEVIITTMVNNQKYFPVVDDEGELKPFFIGVRCGDRNYLDIVAKGNEKVLKARLDDAKFFYEEDIKVPLLSLRTKLDKVIYQEKLGTIGDKIKRIVDLSEHIAKALDFISDDLRESAMLAKMDLATHMVYEFPELQGVMGYYYSIEEGYSKDIAISIKEHYMPVNASDDVPRTTLGIIVGLADKFDTITSIFKTKLIPSGSQDPYALRRMALGIIRTIIENKLKISFKDIISYSQSSVDHLEDIDLEVFSGFFKIRFKSFLEKEGLRYDLIDSIIEQDFDDIYGLYLKSLALKAFSASNDFEKVVTLLIRAKNIIKDNEISSYRKDLLMDEYEIRLEETYDALRSDFERMYHEEDYYGCFELLKQFKEPLDAFFDNVMVMVDDEIIKNNRLGLLESIRKLGEQLFIASNIVIL